MYPKITREILSKFISNQKLDNKHIGITFETDFDYGAFLTFLHRRQVTWESGRSIFDFNLFLTQTRNFNISILYKTFGGISWARTSSLEQNSHEYIIYALDRQVLNEFI